jgi:hypothetical protein
MIFYVMKIGRYLATHEGAPRWTTQLALAAVWRRRVNAARRAEKVGGQVVRKLDKVVHHLDGNPCNNELSNLALIDPKEHP